MEGFTKLILSKGYQQLVIKPESRNLLAVNTHKELFQTHQITVWCTLSARLGFSKGSLKIGLYTSRLFVQMIFSFLAKRTRIIQKTQDKLWVLFKKMDCVLNSENMYLWQTKSFTQDLISIKTALLQLRKKLKTKERQKNHEPLF